MLKDRIRHLPSVAYSSKLQVSFPWEKLMEFYQDSTWLLMHLTDLCLDIKIFFMLNTGMQYRFYWSDDINMRGFIYLFQNLVFILHLNHPLFLSAYVDNSYYWSFERKTYTWWSRKSSYFWFTQWEYPNKAKEKHMKSIRFSKDHLQGIVTLCLIFVFNFCFLTFVFRLKYVAEQNFDNHGEIYFVLASIWQQQLTSLPSSHQWYHDQIFAPKWTTLLSLTF